MIINLFDIETAIQELDTRIMSDYPEEMYASNPNGHPHRAMSKIYAAICRPQMYFGSDYVAEYTKVINMMDEFMKNFGEIVEMADIRKTFAMYCNKEYNMGIDVE